MLKDLERPGDVFRDLGPSWFASVMGAGIVAISADTLPFSLPGLRTAALVVWAMAAAWLLVAVRAAHSAARGRLFLPVGVPQPA